MMMVKLTFTERLPYERRFIMYFKCIVSSLSIANLLVVELEGSYLFLTNLGDFVCEMGIIAIPVTVCAFYVRVTLLLYLLKA